MLLNVCCAPCALPIIEHLIDPAVKADQFTLFFYGPNIYPEDEYGRRLEAARKVAANYHLDLFEGEYDHSGWLAYLKSKLSEPLESYQENGERCLRCFEFRLDETAKFAKAKGFDRFATTLSVSRYKDVFYINQYGRLTAERYGLNYHPFLLNPELAHKSGLELSRQLGVYRQKYCGCEFSLSTAAPPK